VMTEKAAAELRAEKAVPAEIAERAAEKDQAEAAGTITARTENQEADARKADPVLLEIKVQEAAAEKEASGADQSEAVLRETADAEANAAGNVNRLAIKRLNPSGLW